MMLLKLTATKPCDAMGRSFAAGDSVVGRIVADYGAHFDVQTVGGETIRLLPHTAFVSHQTSNYVKVELTAEDARRIVKRPGWERVGEDTAGPLHWNRMTGELVSMGDPPHMERLQS